jgi:hypothetical protein
MRSNYVLNHVHTLELTVSLEAALADVHRWLAAAAAGGKAGVGAATPAAIAAVLGGAPDLGIHQPNGDGASGIVFADAAGISPENESEPESSGLAPVDKDGLDFLAVGFTICKMCFTPGSSRCYLRWCGCYRASTSCATSTKPLSRTKQRTSAASSS